MVSGFGLYLRRVASGGVVVSVGGCPVVVVVFPVRPGGWWLLFSLGLGLGFSLGRAVIVIFGRLRPIWVVDLHCFYLGFLDPQVYWALPFGFIQVLVGSPFPIP